MKRFFAWIGSGWRLPLVAAGLIAGAFFIGWRAQVVSDLLREEARVRSAVMVEIAPAPR